MYGRNARSVFLAGLLASTCFAAAADDLLKRGVETLQAGKTTQAVELLRRAVKADPANRDACYTLGVAVFLESYQALNEFRARYGPLLREGQEMLRKSLEIDPEFGDAMLYSNLLYRIQADIAPTGAEAAELRAKAGALIEAARKVRGKGKPGPIPPPPPLPPPAR